MKRNKLINIRISDKENKLIENNSLKVKMNKSDYIRTMIFNQDTFLIDKKGIIDTLSNIQTVLNKNIQKGISQRETAVLCEEVNSLWQYLE